MISTIGNGLYWLDSSPNKMSFQGAQDYAVWCNKELREGFNDWRVPSIEELISLIDFSKSNPASFLHDMQSSSYWSASSLAPDPTYAWIVDFYSGYVSTDDKTGNSYVRLVRGIRTSI